MEAGLASGLIALLGRDPSEYDQTPRLLEAFCVVLPACRTGSSLDTTSLLQTLAWPCRIFCLGSHPPIDRQNGPFRGGS